MSNWHACRHPRLDETEDLTLREGGREGGREGRREGGRGVSLYVLQPGWADVRVVERETSFPSFPPSLLTLRCPELHLRHQLPHPCRCCFFFF